MKFRKLKRSENILIASFVIGLVIVFRQLWVIPHLAVVRDLESASENIQTKIADSEKLLSDLKARTPATQDSKTSQDILDKYLKSNDRFSNIVTSIVANANDRSFSLRKISAEGQIASNGYTQTPYTLEVDSTFISIGKFFESLEDSPLLTEVDSIDIIRVDNEMKRCKATIKLFSYVTGGMIEKQK